MVQVSFCTPIIRENSCFMNTVEKYTWFGGKVAEVVHVEEDGLSYAIEGEESISWIATTAKVATMILTLGLLPLVALLIKAISRGLSNQVCVQDDADFNRNASEARRELRKLFELVIPFGNQIMARAQAIESGADILPVVNAELIEKVRQKKAEVDNLRANLPEGVFKDLDAAVSKRFDLYAKQCPTFDVIFPGYA